MKSDIHNKDFTCRLSLKQDPYKSNIYTIKTLHVFYFVSWTPQILSCFFWKELQWAFSLNIPGSCRVVSGSTIMIIALNQCVRLLFLFSITTDQRHFLTFIVFIPCHVGDIEVNSKCEEPKWRLAWLKLLAFLDLSVLSNQFLKSAFKLN